MKKFLDTDHPAFRPLWVRIAIVAVAARLGPVRDRHRQPVWAVIFLALAAYAAWVTRGLQPRPRRGSLTTAAASGGHA